MDTIHQKKVARDQGKHFNNEVCDRLIRRIERAK
jgi:hypothetical protein